ncbi:hypothetical protein GGR58DRAFT_492505 [Xylaria digitata]|nr:hypothetical protein GGR58DRAFT_492505 [Xylaria digitata]
MQLKRKRSESELSTSTTSTFNSPPRFGSLSPQSSGLSVDTSSFTFAANLPVSPLSHFSHESLQFPHVPGRMMKRLRDNRPSEHEVHQRTLNMLYAAQRRQTHGTCTANQQQQHTPITVQPGSSSPSPHQTNLHSFWNLPSRPSAPPAACLPLTTADTPTECEDCGQGLGGDDDGTMMDLDDMSSTGGTSCGACGKHVCSHCSITNLGERRRCLGCARTTTETRGSARAPVSWTRGMTNWLC